MRINPRLLLAAAALGCLYALGALLPFWYLQAPASGAPFFPPAGLTLAALLLTPRRTWPLWLAAAAVAEMTVDLSHGQTLFMAVGFATANVIEPLVSATLLRSVARRGRTSTRLGWLVKFVVCAVFLGPLVGAAIGGATAAIAGIESLTVLKWWLGDALGVLVIATPILAWARRDAFEVTANLTENVVIALVAIVVTVAPAVLGHLSVGYAVLPVLMFAALRGGPLGVGIAGLGVAFGANWLVATGRGHALVALKNSENALIDLQLFLGVTLLAALAFAVEVSERTRAERVLRETEAERVRSQFEARNAMASERRKIAGEVHDIVGHALNVMILASGAARRLFSRDPSEAESVLKTAEDVGRDAFRDLDLALALVDQSSGPQTPGLADLDELVERLTSAGLDVEYALEGSVRPLPRLVDWSAYRIIQESLTNVAKHASDARARVNVRYESGSVLLTVADNGTGSARANGRNGRGLIGMRERVGVLGGSIEAGPGTGGGFVVSAELPTERD